MNKSLVGVLVVCAASAFGQGSLTPPGAPAPTMKTLDQVEARTPITSLPFTIAQPGSYYLAAPLSSTNHGIVIQTNRVTVDLMGFAITGDGGYGDHGIWIAGVTNAALRDVVVRGGLVIGFGEGVLFDQAQNCRLEKMTVSGNFFNGLWLCGASGQCDGNTIADCNVSGNNAEYCVYFDGFSGQCNANTMVNCTINDNSTYGVYLFGQNGQCDGNTITRCSISDNLSVGIQIVSVGGQCNDNTLSDCAILRNGHHGVQLIGTSGQCEGNRITGCAISESTFCGILIEGTSGLCDGNTVADCAIHRNGSYGIKLDGTDGQCDGNTVTHCILNKNTDSGIYVINADANRIQNNHVTATTGDSTYGIYTEATRANFFFQNSCVGHTNNYQMNTNDTYGPIVVNAGQLGNTGVGAQPWQNYSR